MKKLGRPASTELLTPTEWRVAEGVRHGLSNPALATHLGVSLNAIKFHVSNVLQKTGLKSRLALKLWTGTRRTSPLFARKRTMETHMKISGLGQIARQVHDLERSEAWYRDVLGLPHLFRFGAMSFFDCGGVRLLLSAGASASSDSLLYFTVDDIHAMCTQLQSRGVQLSNAPHMIHRHPDGTEEWMAFFKDLEDRPLGLMSSVT
jgi:DNA-binding CsgD family transcriptional regulator/catechol 2,3-dioxygenase-like lactoylglutathione lyase family enzyme